MVKKILMILLGAVILAGALFLFYKYYSSRFKTIRPSLSSLPPSNATGMPKKSTLDNFAKNKLRISKKGDFYLPILLYHHIAKTVSEKSYYVSPEIFDQQMAWLKENGYNIVTYDDFYQALTNQKQLPDKPAVISFDDGDRDQYTNGLPILKKYGYRATFFIKLNSMDKKGNMTWAMVKDLANNGMEIGSHSVNHDDMAKMKAQKVDYELSQSKIILEKNLGIPIKYFAYPGGTHSLLVIEELKKTGYLSAVTTHHKVYHNPKDNVFLVPRIHIDSEMPTFIDWVQGNNLK